MEELSKRLVERLNEALAALEQARVAQQEFSADLRRAARAPGKSLAPGQRFARQTDASRRKLETLLTEALETAQALRVRQQQPDTSPAISPNNLAGHFRSLVDKIQAEARQPAQGEVGATLKSLEVEVKGLIVVEQDEARLLAPSPTRGIDPGQLSTVRMAFGAIPVVRPTEDLAAELADVVVRKTGLLASAPARRNWVISVALEVENLGPAEAHNVVLTDELDNQVARAFGFLTNLGKWTITTPPRLEAQLGNLEPGQKALLSYSAETKPFDRLTGTATAHSDTLDPQPGNNAAAINLTPPQQTEQADLALKKSGALTATTAGKVVQYTLVVSNQGPALARNVVVIDRPDRRAVMRVTEFAASKGQWTRTELPELTASLGDLKAGETVTLKYLAFMHADARHALNQAEARSDTADPTPDNNKLVLNLNL